MIPVYQTLTLANNQVGNCFNACVASILELRLEDTAPHILPNIEEDWWEAWATWFKEHDCRMEYHRTAPRGYSIASGRSNRVYPDFHRLAGQRIHHAVVAFDGIVVHDPFPIPGEIDDITLWQTITKVN